MKRLSAAWKTAIAEYLGQISTGPFLGLTSASAKSLHQLSERPVSSEHLSRAATGNHECCQSISFMIFTTIEPPAVALGCGRNKKCVAGATPIRANMFAVAVLIRGLGKLARAQYEHFVPQVVRGGGEQASGVKGWRSSIEC